MTFHDSPSFILDSREISSQSPAMKRLKPMVPTTIIIFSLAACSPPPTPVPSPPLKKSPTLQPSKTPSPEKPAKPVVETATIKEIDITRLFSLKTENKALIYDVRLPLYYQLGHISDAILFYPKPFDKAFDREKPAMEKALSEGKTIVLYCGAVDCHDSHIVAKMIAERGIPVSVYSGGWAEWKEVGIE